MSRGKWAGAGAVLLILLGLGWYFGSPAWTLRQMKSAADANDSDAFGAYVDFPALREDLKAELMAEMVTKAQREDSNGDEFAGLGLAFGNAMVGPMIDGMVSPEGLRAAFLARGRTGEMGNTPFAVQFAEEPVIKRRGFAEFLVASNNQPGKGMVFKRHGLSWKLSGVDTLAEPITAEREGDNNPAAKANVDTSTLATPHSTTASSTTPKADTNLARPDSCLFELEGKKLIEGECTSKRESDYAIVYGDKVFAQVQGSDDEGWTGYWGETHAHNELGLMRKNASCFENDRAKICLR